jgi:hypothetical protein
VKDDSDGDGAVTSKRANAVKKHADEPEKPAVPVKRSGKKEDAKADGDAAGPAEKRKAGRPKKGDSVEKKQKKKASKPRATEGVGSRTRSRAK